MKTLVLLGLMLCGAGAATAVNLPTCCCQVAGSTTTIVTTTTTTATPTTTTTTLCPTPNGSPCGPGAPCFCLAGIPSGDNLCVDGSTATVIACSSDADCSGGKHCIDGTPLGPPTACVASCATTTTTLPGPCAAEVYCDCAGDPRAGPDPPANASPPLCTTDADCLSLSGPGFECVQLNDPDSAHCVRPTCTVFGCSDNGDAACATVCADHGGTNTTFCYNGTCVGGSNAGNGCDSVYAAIGCPGSGDCSGPIECDCTTSTTTTTTTTTTL